MKTTLVKFDCTDRDVTENGLSLLLINKNFPQLQSAGATLNQNVLFIGNGGSSSSYRENDENKNVVSQTLPFALLSDGTLQVSKRLDRETVDLYEMLVVCRDQSFNKTINLIVKLNDVNDNCPRSLVPPKHHQSNQFNRTIFVNKNNIFSEENGLRHAISLFNVNYSDADIGQNSQLEFELQTHSQLFKLDVVKHMTVSQLANPLESPIYSLFIRFNLNFTKRTEPDTITNRNMQKAKEIMFINQLKVGKYLIKVKIGK